MSTIRIGLVGFGTWARTAYLPVLRELDGVTVTAVSARSPASRRHAEEMLGRDVARCGDYRELLARDDVDAFLIALPNALHADALVRAAATGRHLFYEPPVGLNRADADRALAALEAADGVVQADLELRYLPVVDAVVEVLQREGIGEPRMAGVRLWCNWGYQGGPWEEDVGAQGFFLWLGCWYLDLLDRLFGRAPLRAHVVGGRASTGRLLDHGCATLTYAGDGLGQFLYSLVAVADTEITLWVAGAAGEVRADLLDGSFRWRGADGAWCSGRAPAAEPCHGFAGMRECLSGFVLAINGQGRRPAPAVRSTVDVCRRVQAAAFLCAEADAARV